MKSFSDRLISIILVGAMLFGMMPMNALAVEDALEVPGANGEVKEATYEGKTIACVGDSITAAVGVTKDENDYVKLLADRLGMDYIRLGYSGTTLCTDGSRTCNIGRLTEVNLNGADVVTIAMGINDFCAAGEGYYKLGNIDSTDSSTIYGAVRMWCERIEELRGTDSLGDTSFYFLTPVICSWNNSVTSKKDWDQSKKNIHGYTLRDLCNAIVEVAELYDVGVIDLNLLSGMYYVDAQDNNVAVFGGDGVHPGAGGHEMMADAIAKVLRQDNLRDDHVHTFGSWITTTWPSCVPGEQQRVCTVCCATESRIADPIEAHSYEAQVIAPTCTEQGYTTYTCECGDSYVGNFVDALGHSYENGACTGCGSVEPFETMSMRYDDHLDITGKTVEIVDAGTPTSYQVGYGVAENEVPDTAAVCIKGNDLVATGIGSAKVRIDGQLYEITVEPAPISLLLIIGQSNAEGMEGVANQSIVCPDGQVYSTYAMSNGLTGDAGLTVENAGNYVPSSLTGVYSTINVNGTDTKLSGYPVNSLTEDGNGKYGMDSGLAYEWVKQTGEKVWVINAAHGASSITSWQKGQENYDQAVALFGACQTVLQAEIAAGHYIFSHMGYYWNQGCADETRSAEWYVGQFLSMHDNLKTDLARDLDGNTTSADNTLEFGNIILVQAGHSTAVGYRRGTYEDNSDKFFMTYKELELRGPRVAQLWMANNPDLTDIHIVSTLAQDWVTMPDGGDGVADYFQAVYKNGTVDYTTQIKQSASWYTPTTPTAVKDSIHYNQIGYNEIGRESARNTLYILGILEKPEVETSVTLLDWTGFREAEEVKSSAVGSSSTLVVPMVSPCYESKTVTYTLSNDLTWEYYDLLDTGVDGGTLVASVGNQTVNVVGRTYSAFRFELVDGKMVSVDNHFFQENTLTATTVNTYNLADTILLKHDKEWIVEFNSVAADRFMALASTNASTDGMFYFFKSKSGSGVLSVGVYKDGLYQNYGMQQKNIKVDWSQPHVYRFQNVINDDGTNIIHIYIDDLWAGTATNLIINDALQNTDNMYLSGKDFAFNSIGCSGFGLGTGQMTYLEVFEDGHIHNYSTTVTAPTCTEQGYTTYTCECGESYVGDFVDATGHSEVTDPALKPTAERTGRSEGSHCGICGTVLVPQEEIPARGYEWMLEDGEFKLLLIGNSFSEDASSCGQGMKESQLYNILQAMLGQDIKVTLGLLYSGGKGVHWYATQTELGSKTPGFYVITPESGVWKSHGGTATTTALSWTDWDVVTLQPYDMNFSLEQEAVPYPEQTDEKFYPLEVASEYMLDCISVHAPQADVYCYMHWARSYSATLNVSLSTYLRFAEFYPKTLEYAGTESGLRYAGLIPVGLSIQNARSTYLALLSYNSAKGITVNLVNDPQIGLQRDGGHVTFNVGRYIAGLTFAETLLPEQLRAENYVLPGIRITESVGQLPAEYTEIAQKSVFAAVKSWRDGSLAVTNIEGYNEDPTVAAVEQMSGFALPLSCGNSENLEQRIADAVLAELPADFAVDSVHTESGNKTATVTIRFGYTSAEITGTWSEAEHIYEAKVTAPTCTEQGYTTYTCQCGDSYVGDFVDAVGHTYSNSFCNVCGKQKNTTAIPLGEGILVTATPENYLTISNPATEKLACAPGLVTYGEGKMAVAYLADDVNTVETESSTTIVCRLGLFNLDSPQNGTFLDIAAPGQTVGEATIGQKAPYEPNLLVLEDGKLLVLFNIRDASGKYMYYSATVDPESKTVTGYTSLTLDGKTWIPENIATSYNAISNNTISNSGPTGSMVFTSQIVKQGEYYYGYCGGICSGFGGILVRSTDGINWTSVMAPEALPEMAGVIECGFQFIDNYIYFCMRDISSGVYQCSYDFTTGEQLVRTHKLSELTTSKPTAFTQDGKLYLIVNKATGDDATVGRRNTALFYEVDPDTCRLSLVRQVFCADGCAYHSVVSVNGTNYWAFHTDARRISPYTQGRSNLAFLTVPALYSHSYESVITAPSCTQQGYTTHTCTICGHTYVDSYVEALGHRYENKICIGCGKEKSGTLNLTDYSGMYASGCITVAANVWQTGVVNYHYQIPLSDFADYNQVTVTANGANKSYIAFFTHRMIEAGTIAYAEGWTEVLIMDPGTTQTLPIPADAQYMYILNNNAAGDSLLPESVVFSCGHSYENGACTLCGQRDYRNVTYVAFGDSITYGVDGNYRDGPGRIMDNPYPKLVGQHLEFRTVNNQAVSGGTLCADSGRTNMTERILNFNGEADVISIMLGVNDYQMKCPMGDVDSTDNKTIFGSLNLICQYLTENYPDAFLFFMTPFQYRGGEKDKGAGYNLPAVVDAIKTVAGNYGIPVLDMYTYGRYEEEFNDTSLAYQDGIHPSQGHHIKYTAPLIVEFIAENYEGPAPDDSQGGEESDGKIIYRQQALTKGYCSKAGKVENSSVHSYFTMDAEEIESITITPPDAPAWNPLDIYYIVIVEENGTVSSHGKLGKQEPTVIELGGKVKGTVYFNAFYDDHPEYVYVKEALVVPHEHDYEAAVTAPTCTEQGYTTHTCKCGDSYVDAYTNALGHAMGNWTVTKAPTCTAEGTEERICSRCSYKETRTVAATGHSDTPAVTAPTCTEQGYTTYTCTICGNSYVGDYVGALGHEKISHAAQAATCTEIGWDAYETCSRCEYSTYTEIDAIGHSHKEVVTAPTCTEQGYSTYTCHCSDSYVDSYVDALGHSFGEWGIITDSTCTEAGEERRDCDRCDHFETRAVDAHGHDLIEHEAKNTTCTEIGWNAYETCSRCDYSTYMELSALGHNEAIDAAVAPTCTAPGLTEGKHCARCGEVLEKQETVAKLDHTPAAVVKENEVKATCTKAGSYDAVIYCSVCNTEISRETKSVDKLLHTEELVPGKPATETETGLTDGIRCSECGTVIKNQEVIDKLPPSHVHDYQTVVTESTCTEKGYTTYTCTCGDSYIADEVAAKGHKEQIIPAVEATCVSTGLTEGTKCSVCDAILKVQEVAEKLPHAYKATVTEATCTEPGYTTYTCTCGDRYIADEVPAKGHSYGEWTVIKEANCTEKGTEQHNCVNCEAFETRAIEAVGHNYVEVVTAPTCTQQGFTTHTCTCGDGFVDNEVEPLGHSFTEYVSDNNATCTEDGTKTAKCDRCDAKDTVAEVGSATGHKWDDGEVTKAPEAGLEGEMTYTCEACGDTRTEVIPALPEECKHTTTELVSQKDATCTETGYSGDKVCTSCGETIETGTELPMLEHDAVIDEGVDATCTDPGLTEGKHCANCDTVLVKQEVVDALGHDFGEWEIETEATCTDRGEELRFCAACDAFESRQTEATGHSFTDYISDDNATCTEDGTKTAVCDNCDAEDTVADEGSAIGHDWDDGEITKEPAIGAEGIKTFTCRNCCETRSESIPALPDKPEDEPCTHSSVELVNQKDATCTETGYSGDKVCVTCGELIEQGSAVAKIAHTEVIDKAVAATCTKDGKTEGKHCSVCNTVLAKQEVVSATGHSFGMWVETVPATSVSGGEEKRTCENCGIEEKRSTEKLANPFVDVKAGAYYELPVLWAVKKGITNGMTPTTFQPDTECTRAQVVTFLWRASGEPEPVGKNNPFADVKESDYFYKAVLWAVEEGITKGISADRFAPSQSCTRAQVATFLWRAQGQPKAENRSHPFTDIDPKEYYYDAVLWAVENGVTNGMSEATFAPNSTCTRGQIVTFLYRALENTVR